MKKLLFTLLFLFAGVVTTQAQTADDYFHSGAQSYINADLQSAITQVQEGLNQFPNDPKLNSLLQKLEEEQEKQQQQQQQQQQNQENQEQQEQDQQNQEQQEQEQSEEEQEQEQEQEQNEGQNNEQDQPEEQEGKPQDARELSKEEAEKILKALAQKEKELLKEFKKQKKSDAATHDKDW